MFKASDNFFFELSNNLVLNMIRVGPQDLNQVMSNAGLVTGSNSSQEITLTINNSSLTQALAQASAAGSSAAPGNPQEITLTISGMDN